MNELLKKKIPALIFLAFLIAVSSAHWTHAVVNSKEDQRHVQFGWPVKYITQNQEKWDPPYPYSLGMTFGVSSDTNWTNLLIDTGFFLIVLTMMVALLYYALPNHRRWLTYFRLRYIVGLIVFGILLLVGIIWFQSSQQPKIDSGVPVELENPPGTPFPLDDNNDLISRQKAAIESKYPEFKNFENQKSFAGQSIRMTTNGSDHYYAYIVHGSGLPIIQATCFRVDRAFRVYKVGEFPDPVDSYMGYPDINPMNCKGIR